jgi:hypothetical protein
MRKLLYLLTFILLTLSCYGQYATTITISSTPGETSKLSYLLNSAGDSLSLNKSTFFRLSIKSADAYLISNTDTLKLSFNDTSKQVNVGLDSYFLYPNFYEQFKQRVMRRHSVMAVLELLEDNIGDYFIEPALPLILFKHATSKRIRKAKITTRRSQADLTDLWEVSYHYNLNGRLEKVIAASSEETRFSKKLSYKGNSLISIKTHLNIETRQITDKTITYPGASIIKWHEHVLRTGLNVQTEYKVTLTRILK